MRINGTRLVVIASLVGVVLCVGVGWYQALDRTLSVPPRREAGLLMPGVPVSQMSLNVTVPLKRLQAAVEAQAPKTYEGGGDGPDVCARLGVKLCAGTHYDFSAERGPLTLSEGPGNTIRMAMPLKVTGQGGFRGDGAKLLRIAPKRFEATTDAWADLSLGLTQDWCPKVQARVDFSNLNAKLEIVANRWVTVGALVENGLKDKLRQLAERAASAIPCDEVRKAAQAAWVARSFPLPLPGDGRSLHVNVEPVNIGFSGVQVTASAAKLMLSVGAKLSVTDTVLDGPRKPLPHWEPVALKPGALQLAVPLRISYEGLESRLSTLLQKQLSMQTPAGEATLVADELIVYPAGERIAVGAHVRAHLPGQYLNSRGWLYVTARPVVSPDGRAIRFADITYSRILDNRLTNLLTLMMDSQIREQLTRAGQFDLSPTIAKARELLSQGLAQHSRQLEIHMGEPSLRLGRIIPGAGALFIEGLFSSGADVTVLETH